MDKICLQSAGRWWDSTLDLEWSNRETAESKHMRATCDCNTYLHPVAHYVFGLVLLLPSAYPAETYVEHRISSLSDYCSGTLLGGNHRENASCVQWLCLNIFGEEGWEPWPCGPPHIYFLRSCTQSWREFHCHLKQHANRFPRKTAHALVHTYMHIRVAEVIGLYGPYSPHMAPMYPRTIHPIPPKTIQYLPACAQHFPVLFKQPSRRRRYYVRWLGAESLPSDPWSCTISSSLEEGGRQRQHARHSSSIHSPHQPTAWCKKHWLYHVLSGHDPLVREDQMGRVAGALNPTTIGTLEAIVFFWLTNMTTLDINDVLPEFWLIGLL